MVSGRYKKMNIERGMGGMVKKRGGIKVGVEEREKEHE